MLTNDMLNNKQDFPEPGDPTTSSPRKGLMILIQPCLILPFKLYTCRQVDGKFILSKVFLPAGMFH